MPWAVISTFLTDYLATNAHLGVPGATAVLFSFGIGCFAGTAVGGYLGCQGCVGAGVVMERYLLSQSAGGDHWWCSYVNLSLTHINTKGEFPWDKPDKRFGGTSTGLSVEHGGTNPVNQVYLLFFSA